MSTTITPILEPPRVPISREMYHGLHYQGTLPERCELVAGAIWQMLPSTEPHNSLVMALLFLMAEIFGPEYVRCKMPVILDSNSEPEPDILVTAGSRATYVSSGMTPSAADVRLIVEVSVSTLEYDLREKAAKYAASDIADYWVLDVVNRRLIVHRLPSAGGYQQIDVFDEAQSVAPLAAPQTTIAVKDILP